MLICSFSCHDNTGKIHQFELNGEEHPIEDNILLLQLSVGDAIVEIKVNFQNDNIMIPSQQFSIPTFAGCVLACASGSLAQDIAGCLQLGKNTPKKMLKCLRLKGHSMTATFTNCVIACAVGAVVGP